MSKEDKIIDNIKKIINSAEAEDIMLEYEFGLCDFFIEQDERFVSGRFFTPKYVIQTCTNPIILLLRTHDLNFVQRVRLIVKCRDEVKLNIMSSQDADSPAVVKVYKDETDWQIDLDMLAYAVFEHKRIDELLDDEEDDDFDYLF